MQACCPVSRGTGFPVKKCSILSRPVEDIEPNSFGDFKIKGIAATCPDALIDDVARGREQAIAQPLDRLLERSSSIPPRPLRRFN